MKTLLVFLSLCFGLCTTSVGQVAASSPTPPASSTKASPPPPAVYNLEFAGGTLTELLEKLRSVDKGPLNVVLTEGAGEMPVPKMTLVGVMTPQVLEALANMQPLVGRWTQAGGAKIWVVSRWESIHDAELKASPGWVRPVYVGQLLKKFSVDDLAAAITFALTRKNNEKPNVRLRLHKETSLLIIEASAPEVDTAIQVIQELKQALPSEH